MPPAALPGDHCVEPSDVLDHVMACMDLSRYLRLPLDTKRDDGTVGPRSLLGLMAVEDYNPPPG